MPAPREALQPGYRWDFFVSHASEDKAAFVDAMVNKLKLAGPSVWYDSNEMLGGGSQAGDIDAGLRGSRFYVVVASPNYFSKPWATGELHAMLNNDLSHGRTRVLPVLLGMKASDIGQHSTLLASRKVVADAAEGRDSVIVALLALLNAAKTVK